GVGLISGNGFFSSRVSSTGTGSGDTIASFGVVNSWRAVADKSAPSIDWADSVVSIDRDDSITWVVSRDGIGSVIETVSAIETNSVSASISAVDENDSVASIGSSEGEVPVNPVESRGSILPTSNHGSVSVRLH